MPLEVREPNPEFKNFFFHQDLLASKPYSLKPSFHNIKLDQNENPFDWGNEFKKEVTEKLFEQSWHTYPEDYPRELKNLLADYVGLNPKNIVLSPGSNYHITVLLNLFSAKKNVDIILTRPSFPLFEGHCLYQNIPYQTWNLNKNLEYDLELLPKMKKGSVLFFASPNNPVGNVLSKDLLKNLLEAYPECYFVADEAYWEFTEQNYSSLLVEYANLIIVRTFSKAMGSAGLRLSYALSSESFCRELSKVTLPFLVNKFTTVAASSALKSRKFMTRVWDYVAFVKKERERLYKEISTFALDSFFKVLSSEANFISLKCSSPDVLKDVQACFFDGGILVRNVSNPSLENTLRVSIGKKEENDKVLFLLEELFS